MKAEPAKKPKQVAEPNGVSAVNRALTVLTAFQRGDSVLSLAELTERTGLVKSTVLRLAVSLQEFGLLRRLEDGGYRLDAEVMRLAACYQHAFGLADHIMPVLTQLATATGETATFYTKRGAQRLCLFRVESANNIRMHVQPGDLRPMDRSAIAQVLRLFETKISAPDVETPIFTSGVTDPHAAALAAPVFGAGGSLLGALAISGPITRLTTEVASKLKKTLKEAADELTAACGG